MTQLVSDIRILDNLLALNLNVSLWSARRKMSQEDLGSAELPPEDLASLGSKRIADPENLKVFGTLKARAFNYLDRHGVRFMLYNLAQMKNLCLHRASYPTGTH